MKFGLVFTQDLLQGARNLAALEMSRIDCSPEKNIRSDPGCFLGAYFFWGGNLHRQTCFVMQEFPKVSILRKLLHFWEMTDFYACLNHEFSKLSTPLQRLNRKNVFSDYELC
jgi:hypothetical protein